MADTSATVGSDNRRMALVVNSIEFKLILKWQKGKFSTSDDEKAKAWKNVSAIDLEPYKMQLIESGYKTKASSLAELRPQVDYGFKSDPNQKKLLSDSCAAARMTQEDMFFVFYRWNQAGRPKFSDFAPYSYYCMLVEEVFKHGLASDLVRTSAAIRREPPSSMILKLFVSPAFGVAPSFERWPFIY
jgi:hypothetical protein